MKYIKKLKRVFIVFLVSSLVMACATMTPLIKSTRDGDISKMNALISSGGNVNERDPKTGWTPLQYAIHYNQINAVRFLTEKGADINIADENGRTPLLLAIGYNYKDIIYILLDKEADINTPDKDGHTPLIQAFYCGYFDIAKTLIERGANVNVADARGYTALILAVQYNNIDIVNILLAKGADLEISDKSSPTALMHAVLWGNIDIATTLIHKGANINTLDKYGATALIVAIKSGQIKIAKMLIEEGADIHKAESFSYGYKASDYARFLQNPSGEIFKATDYDRRESLLELLNDIESKQISGNVNEIKQAESTQIPIKEISPEEREQNKKIAILPARFPPQTDTTKPSFSRMAGAGKGALGGAAIGARIGLEGFAGGGLFGLLLLPITTTLGAVTGAVVGAVSADPKEESLKDEKAREMEQEINKSLLALKIQETMAKQVQEAGKREISLDFIVFTDMGPSSPTDKPDYSPLMNQGVEAVLEVDVKKIGAEYFGGKWADLYYFYMIVQARLVRGSQSCTQEYKYIIGPPRTYSEWIEAGVEALQKEIERAYEALAEDIVDFVFLYTYFEATDSPLARIYNTGHLMARKWPIPFSGIYNTRYILGSMSGIGLMHPEPPDTATFPCSVAFSSESKMINTLQPTFRWETFPTAEDIRVDRKRVVSRISNVTYDLRLWRVNEKSGRELIYEKKGLMDNKHKIECSLKPGSSYVWTVRARFRLDDQHKVTRWATFPRVYGKDPATGQIRGYGKDLYDGAIPVMRSYYPFTTRAEYKKLNQDSDYK